MRLRHHDQPDERAEQRKDEDEFAAEMDKLRMAGMVNEKIPRVGEDERAAKKAALLEDLVPFFLLRAIEFPLPGQSETGDEKQAARVPAGENEPERDDPKQRPRKKAASKKSAD